MSTSVDKSSKLIFNEFQKSISEVPLEVYYQILTSDSFNSSGYQFNIRQPGTRALLDTDVWIHYDIPLIETQDYWVRNMFNNPVAPVLAANAYLQSQPASDNRLAFRSGYVGWRIMQNFSLQINNQTLTVQPYKYCDILNRLYVSNEQSKHEFSTSGGEFDSGLHSVDTMHMLWRDWENASTLRQEGDFYPRSGDHYADVTQIPITAPPNAGANDWNFVSGGAATGRTSFLTYWSWGFHPGGDSLPLQNLGVPANVVGTQAQVNNRTVLSNLRPDCMPSDYIINKGFSNRFEQLALFLRYNGTAANSLYYLGAQFTPGNNSFVGGNVARAKWLIRVYERLPISLFKMYSNDSVFGAIPNIVSMNIQGTWMNNTKHNLFRCDNGNNGFDVDWTQITRENCKLYLKWYTPPMNMPIPREISCPYPKITQWSKSIDYTYLADNVFYREEVETEYNVTIESIPDLLLIYIRCDPAYQITQGPDDYLMEITDMTLNIDNASGKLNQMSTVDLYNKWKRILKHSDSRITPYDEWRKFCCVAALQPEDYGVRYGPGYSNQSVLGMKVQYKNWWNIPSFQYRAQYNMALQPGPANMKLLLQVVCIYNRNRLILRADGSAAQELLKVAADFNAINSVGQFNEIAESANRLAIA